MICAVIQLCAVHTNTYPALFFVYVLNYAGIIAVLISFQWMGMEMICTVIKLCAVHGDTCHLARCLCGCVLNHACMLLLLFAVWSGCQRPRTHKFDEPAFPSGHRHHQEPEPARLLPEPVHCCIQWGRGCWLHRHPNPCQWCWYWGQWFGGLFHLSVSCGANWLIDGSVSLNQFFD